MEEYRKIQTIEVINPNYKVKTREGKNATLTVEGVLVQNKDNPNDKWVIPADVFKATYEPVKKSDYKLLTSEQRDVIRLTLAKVLENKMKQVVSGAVTVENGAADFIAIQKHVGENFKTYEDKLAALNVCLKIK